MRYLNEQLVKESFLRLRETKPGGKKGLERTSALATFLAFDALLKRTGVTAPIDLDPEDSIGKNNRDILSREFSKLLLIKNVRSSSCHVLNLGVITVSKTSPEKRFSGNFLTVPLKGATNGNKESAYPNRPKPILFLGQKATGITWGMDFHPDWKENLPVFLSDRKSKTPFHDLACFVLRQRGFISEAEMLQDGLSDGLSEIYTKELCDYWRLKLSREKPYVVRAEYPPFQDNVSTAFDDYSWAECVDRSKKTDILTDRINYLEGLLKMHHINFDK